MSGLLRISLIQPTTCSLISCLFVVCLVKGQTIREGVRNHPNWKLLDRGDDCGHSSSNRIIGGKKALLGQYPWIARMGFAAVQRGDIELEIHYTCGGAIISDRYVLTAAHCSPAHNLVQVRLGELDLLTNPDCQDGVCAPPVQDVDIQEYFCHPGFNEKQQHDDICLVRLVRPIKFGRYVQPICLPVYEWFLNNNLEKTVMEVAGWGIENLVNRTTSDVLMTVAVPTVNHLKCQSQFKDYAEIITKQLCAGGVVGQDSCTGDSGGPLMAALAVDAPPRYFLLGIVSYGDSKCATSETPGVYTKVTEYLDWILDHMRQ